MATNTEVKIIEIQVKSSDALNRITVLGREIEALENDLKTLTATYKEGTMHDDYYKKQKTILTAAIKAHRQEVSTLTREIGNNIKQSKEKLGYIQKLEAQVSNLTLKYKQLSEAELKGSKGAEVLKNLTAKREELSTLNQAYGNHTMEVGKYGKATNQLNMQMTQLMREMPNFAISTRIGIMSLTNNLPYFVESMKAVRTELSAMKAAGEKAPSFISALGKSLFSFNAIVMVGITLLQLFGEDIFKWIGSLFKGEEAVKKLTAAEIGLQTQQQIMHDTMKSGNNDYSNAIGSINKMTVALQNARGNAKEEKKALDEYNSTLGVTFGKATSVDGALKSISANKKDYIESMKQMAFANAFFSKSAEDSMKILEIGMKNNSEIIGTESKKYIDAIDEQKEAIRQYKEIYAKGNYLGTKEEYQASLKKSEDYLQLLVSQYNDAANKERQRQIGLVTQHQQKTEQLATKHYKNMSDLFDKNNWNFEEKKTKLNDKQKKLQEIANDVELKLLAVHQENLDKLLDTWFAQMAEKRKLERTTYTAQTILDDIADSELSLQLEEKRREQRRENEANFLNDQLEATIQGSNDEMNARLAIMNSQRQQELAVKELTESQKAAIVRKYTKIESDIRFQTLQNQISASAQAFGAIQGLFKKGSKMQKAAASTQIGIDSIAGAMAAFKSTVGIPVVGPILAPLAAAGVIATGVQSIKDVWSVKEDGVQSVGASSPSLPPDLTSKMASPLTNSVQSMGAMGGSNAITSGAANAAIQPPFDYNAMAKVMSNLPAPELSIVELRTKEKQVDFIDNVSTLKS